MHVSASGSAIATNLAPTRMEERTALTARGIFFPDRQTAGPRLAAAAETTTDEIFLRNLGGGERREVRRSYGMSARWSY